MNITVQHKKKMEINYQKERNVFHVFPSRGFNLCLQTENSSLLLFKVAPSGLNIIKYFSFKHKLQLLVEGLNSGALAIIFQFIL